MARPGPSAQAKRRREIAKQEKRKAKAEKRAQRQEQKAEEADRPVGHDVDPDIAGIVPGPQKPLY